MDCVFCKIINGEIPSTKVYEDDFVLAFLEIAPQAPVHILITPKTHIESIDAITSENSEIAAHIAEAVPKIAAEQGLKNGYRVITNVGEDGAQSIKHLHFHLLGGKNLGDKIV